MTGAVWSGLGSNQMCAQWVCNHVCRSACEGRGFAVTAADTLLQLFACDLNLGTGWHFASL